MVSGVWGRKIGMTQVFVEDNVVPVTAITLADWFVIRIKTKEHDGYNAIQVGCLRDRYVGQVFSELWCKKPAHYFLFVREISIQDGIEKFTVGQAAHFEDALIEGNKVDVIGTSRGRGFAGTVKRYGFAGAPGSHGDTMGKRPGSLSFMRSRGRVIKGKRLPGHMGNVQHMVKNMEIVKVEPSAHVVLIKGAVPGHSGSLVFVRKA